MIKNNQERLNRLHVALDGVVIAISYLLAWYIVYGSTRSLVTPANRDYMSMVYIIAGVLIIPYYLFLYAVFHLYAPKRVQVARVELANIFKANTLGVLTLALILFFGGKNPYFYHFSRPMVVLFYVINTAAETLARNLLRFGLRKMRSNGYNQKHVLLVGYSKAAEGFIDRVRANPEWGYQIRGILDDHVAWGKEYRGIRVIGRTEDLPEILALNTLDEIAITLSLSEYAKLENIVAACEKSGVHTKFIPDYYNFIPTQPYMEDLEGMPVINIRHVPLTNPLNAIMKRIVDIFGALVAIVLFSPIMLVTAALVKLTSPGPVIFSQERVGLHNKPFRMYKFRSMTVQAPEKEKSRWTTPGDARVTPVGRFIRKTSIDEMPQLFNVLKGDMSLVGPRPERPFFVEKFREEIPRYMIKHQVRPGMTGWAQVNGFRGDTSITKRIEHDLYYIENWSLGFDFKILFLTFFKGFINKNAY
ncbi:undecaprenyl-phosphate glucose phosphotransferase [Clostridium vitabionis]|jgi:Undecaprenyl-phosphate glucose phosphotransferase|uniref:undecaprenyl-phosphate glucose phosphotransferase n=1 Tax=Clostridium vitabionis TaxID=2784388 RepID=UPI00188D0565|nr:undecaprenyl-phosphate glucose phosphotransferase [Clostridium vitabionis]